MVDVALNETGESRNLILENREIRAMVKSLHRPAAGLLASQSTMHVKCLKLAENGSSLQLPEAVCVHP